MEHSLLRSDFFVPWNRNKTKGWVKWPFRVCFEKSMLCLQFVWIHVYIYLEFTLCLEFLRWQMSLFLACCNLPKLDWWWCSSQEIMCIFFCFSFKNIHNRDTSLTVSLVDGTGSRDLKAVLASSEYSFLTSTLKWSKYGCIFKIFLHFFICGQF